MPEKEQRITIRVPTPLRLELVALAERNERTPSAEIRRALKAHIEAEGIRRSLAEGHE